jgi:hypothetical protein
MRQWFTGYPATGAFHLGSSQSPQKAQQEGKKAEPVELHQGPQKSSTGLSPKQARTSAIPKGMCPFASRIRYSALPCFGRSFSVNSTTYSLLASKPFKLRSTGWNFPA